MVRHVVLQCACLAAALLLAMAPVGAHEPVNDANAVSQAIASLAPAADQRTARAAALLLQFYQRVDYQPVWTAAASKLALQELQAARQHGLDPADYAVDSGMPAADVEAPGLPAQYDVALTAAMLRFLADLQYGRTPPDFSWSDGSWPQRDADLPKLLLAALREGNPGAAIAATQPGNPLYRRARQALAAYRQLESLVDGLAPLPPLAAGTKLTAGMPYPAAAALRQRLTLLGDMPAGPDHAAGAVYDDALAAGVRRFQLRHGLLQDGVLGKATMAALSVPLAQRIRQLELTLERMRWMPALPRGPVVVINVPSFRLWALDTSLGADTPPLEMRVIVGAAAATPTPLFIGRMRHLEFNPAWNVPSSITLQEFLPKLARDRNYLVKQDMELVGMDGRVVADGPATLRGLRSGALRLRQRPGPKNPLGAVKFAMPNPMSIYLHGTPANQLFARQRRDFSHGCIRLERPAELAAFVLRGQEAWDQAAILEAMAPGPTTVVKLDTPVPVILLYATAMVDRQGQVIFLQDIYGLDQKLDREMAAGRIY